MKGLIPDEGHRGSTPVTGRDGPLEIICTQMASNFQIINPSANTLALPASRIVLLRSSVGGGADALSDLRM